MKDWKNILSYTELLESANQKIDLETLTIKLTQIELQIRAKSKDEFVLWLNDLPSRLDGNKRSTIAEFVSILEQITNAGNDVPEGYGRQMFGNRDKLMHLCRDFYRPGALLIYLHEGNYP